tara:strand:+ start:10979 stop:12781 length:1803 start_codon:yes stop_codon:yes gene_type:complete
MFYSNEVYLVNSRHARLLNCDDDRIVDLDIDRLLLNSERRLSGFKIDSIASRVYKIVDFTPNYFILESVRRGRNLRILCRFQDVLFTNKNMNTIYYSENEGYIHKIIDNDAISYFDKYDISSSIDRISDKENINLIIFDMLVDANENNRLVDNSDSRISVDCRNRFFLRNNIRQLLMYLLKTDCERDYAWYKKCDTCNSVKSRCQNIMFSREDEKLVCQDCYKNKEFSCQSCNTPMMLSNRANLMSTRRSLAGIVSLFKSNDMFIVCGECFNGTIESCSRCKKIDVIDFESLKNHSNKAEYRKEFLERNNYYKMFNSQYCGKCSDMVLSSKLTLPVAGNSLPNSYCIKSDFNRFVGVESEVITNYDCTDDYLDNGSIPDYFRVVSDGSLNSGGVEFVSDRPIIGNEVNIALESLQEINESEYNMTDESCGLHIHMNALDMGFTEIKSLLMIMSRIQNSIYMTIPEDRRTTSFAREITLSPREISKIDSLPKLVYDYYNMADSDISEEKYNEGRYIGTNIHARFYQGSVEFRYHEGVISSNPIERWILFLNKIMSSAISLHNKPRLYSKILSKKFKTIDIIKEVAGVSGAEYIEERIDTNN